MSMTQDMLRRMQADDARLRQTETKETAWVNYGTAMPAGYPLNLPYFRTDLGWWIYNDGTRQLTENEYQATPTEYQRVAFPYAGGAPATLFIAPARTDYSMYITRAKAYLDIIAPNGLANYWGFALRNGGTSVWQFDTSLDAAGAGLNKESGAINSVQAPAFMTFDAVAKVGGPGNVVINVAFWYRLVIP